MVVPPYSRGVYSGILTMRENRLLGIYYGERLLFRLLCIWLRGREGHRWGRYLKEERAQCIRIIGGV